MVTRRRKASLGPLIAVGLFLWVWLYDVAGIRTWAAQAGSQLIVGALGVKG